MSPSALVQLVRSRALAADAWPAFSPPGIVLFDSLSLDDWADSRLTWPLGPLLTDAWRLWEGEMDRSLVLLEDLFDSHAARLAQPGALRIECTTAHSGDTRCVHSFARDYAPQQPRSAPSQTAATTPLPAAAIHMIPQSLALLAAFVVVSVLFAVWIHGQHVFVNKLQ